MDFDPQSKGSFCLSFQVPDVCAKFRRNWFKIATVRARTDRHTDTYIHTQRSHGWSYIICPMLCYSNGTDNNESVRDVRGLFAHCRT